MRDTFVNMSVKKIVVILIIVFSIVRPSIIHASPKTFVEDFSTTPNDQFPLNWVLTNDPGGSNCPNNWRVIDGVLKIAIPQSDCATNIMPDDTIWKDLGDNYIFEADATFVSGSDHAIAFRFVKRQDSNDWYDLHYSLPGDFIIERTSDGNFNTNIPASYENRPTPYHIKIVVNGKNIKVYMDGLLVRDFTMNFDNYPQGRIALRAGGASETYFDNISVTSIDPTTVLSVPLLKQTDASWGNLTYDSANLWSTNQPTIGSWGCALTSAAMVFQYHGITKLPDGTVLDPKNLNKWLQNQPDGYVGNGLLNWLSLSRLSFLAKSQNPLFTSDALEYRRVAGENKTQLAEDISNNIPDILEEPGHYVVAKGTDNTTFFINDPFYNREDLNSYSNTFSSLGRYIPSHTDLSYIMLVVNNNVDITVKDSLGNSVGTSFIQQPITNALTGNTVNGVPVKMFYLPIPTTGDYTAILKSLTSSSYKLKTLLYDKDGNVFVASTDGFVSPSSSDSVLIHFDHNNKNNSKSLRLVTFEEFLADLSDSNVQKLITNKAAYETLKVQIQNAQKDAKNKRVASEIFRLKGVESMLMQYKNTLVKSPALEVLLYDAQYLQLHP